MQKKNQLHFKACSWRARGLHLSTAVHAAEKFPRQPSLSPGGSGATITPREEAPTSSGPTPPAPAPSSPTCSPGRAAGVDLVCPLTIIARAAAADSPAGSLLPLPTVFAALPLVAVVTGTGYCGVLPPFAEFLEIFGLSHWVVFFIFRVGRGGERQMGMSCSILSEEAQQTHQH